MAIDLALLQQHATADGLPPVEEWHPDFCADMDLVIRADGTWVHEGGEFRRPALMKLFSRILRLDDDGCYYLVTPVEKVRIQVEDAPFVILAAEVRDDSVVMVTNCEEVITLGREHPMRVRAAHGGASEIPYVLVRKNLWARLHRNVFYQLVELAEQRTEQNVEGMWLQSQNEWFCLGSL
ncbi:DUF1285 domain-containing protein [Pokkaliibacter plantistimulans]|uniref:DUF1285 domain-containing protein n=1 Tax=Proteobacteria bacterium 228 TaxID=2083153 RepID=A0A2S5KY00_9PROT|nr:DUF1285 domain-containing protein [Pokkaliibacter plantistimulans]PPC79389.1 DUF1285 domain-containing protein [Pokkaliibacter plantistimulans]